MRAALAAFLVASTLTGCVEQPTGIRVHVETDLDVPAVVRAVRLRITPFGDAGPLPDAEPPVGLVATIPLVAPDAAVEMMDGGTRSWVLPLTVGVVPWRDPEGRIVATVEAETDATACLLPPVRKSMRFRPGVVQDLYLELARLCCVTDGRLRLADGGVGEQCGPGQTCGFAGCEPASDDPSVCVPGPEDCNLLDDDCDGRVDEELRPVRCGVGTCRRVPECRGMLGWAACVPGSPALTDTCNGLNEDCDGVETCDPFAADCDGLVDEGWWPDADGDGFGDAARPGQCGIDATHTVARGTDCDDTRASVWPGAAEVCDGSDQDCDGRVDEGVLRTWYRDFDGDGYGCTAAGTACGADWSVQACVAPPRYVSRTGDCNDDTGAVHPGASERPCSGYDDDCNPATPDNPCPSGAFCQSAPADARGYVCCANTGCGGPCPIFGDCRDPCSCCSSSSTCTAPGFGVCHFVSATCRGNLMYCCDR